MKIRNKNVYWMLFLCMIVNMYGVVSADLSPRPRSFADTPAPTQKNEEVSVEMVKEVVELTLYKEHLDVVAEFWMRNHDKETVHFETGFPVGAFVNMVDFSVAINGKEIPATLIDRHSSKTYRITPYTPGEYNIGYGLDFKDRMELIDRENDYPNYNDYWYVWDATYPGGSTEKHVVRYSVELRNYHHPAGPFPTGYILSTGKAWKNPIGKAIVTLRVGGGMYFDYIRETSPLTGRKVYKDKVVWTRSNFEPESYDDIRIEYSRVPAFVGMPSDKELEEADKVIQEMQDERNMHSPDSILLQRENSRSKIDKLSKWIQDSKRKILEGLMKQNNEVRQEAQKVSQQNRKKVDDAAARKSKEMMDQSDADAEKLREMQEKLNNQFNPEAVQSKKQMNQAMWQTHYAKVAANQAEKVQKAAAIQQTAAAVIGEYAKDPRDKQTAKTAQAKAQEAQKEAGKALNKAISEHEKALEDLEVAVNQSRSGESVDEAKSQMENARQALQSAQIAQKKVERLQKKIEYLQNRRRDKEGEAKSIRSKQGEIQELQEKALNNLQESYKTIRMAQENIASADPNEVSMDELIKMGEDVSKLKQEAKKASRQFRQKNSEKTDQNKELEKSGKEWKDHVFEMPGDEEIEKMMQESGQQENKSTQNNQESQSTFQANDFENAMEAMKAIKKDDYQTALEILKPLTVQGNARAQSMLGDMYARGQGVSKDEKEAVNWYRKAAMQGGVYGENSLGNMYYKGRGVPQDYIEAYRWFRKASGHGMINACFMLRTKYSYVEGSILQDPEAVKSIRNSAEQGDADAQYLIGLRCYFGKFGSKGHGYYENAFEWYSKAAEQGHDEAQFNIGVTT